MTVRGFLVRCSLLALVVGAPALAQQSTFQDVTDVLVIEVPVQVTRDGKPVRGLTAKNFELLAGGKKQQLVGFQEVDLGRIEGVPASDQVEMLPVVARRHFLFLFDLSFARPAGILKAQAAAQRLALERLHPSDLVGVATYQESTGAKLLLGFTSDRRQIDLALATLGYVDPSERVNDPLGIVMADYQVYMERFGGYESDLSRTTPFGIALIPDAQWLNNMKDMVSMSGRANRDQVRNQILDLSRSLTELAENLASVDGRKYLVFFSEGFDSSSLLGTDDSERIQELNKEASYGLLWRVDSDERFGDVATQQGVFDMLDQFRKCDCTIEAVDIGGIRADGEFEARASGEQSLFVMADQTGGELYRNYNDLGEAMATMLERTSVTYLLSWQPKEAGVPGQFYPIRVKLKGGPKGSRVVHRPGYYAPRSYVQLDADERRLQTIELLMEGREGGALDAALFTAPFLGASGDSKVLTLIEIEGYSLLRGHRESVLPTEVFAYALDADGSVADFLGQAVTFDLQKVRPALDNRGFKFFGRLDLDPGEYEIRVVVRNVVTGATATRISRVTVPAFDMAESTLLPPFFVEPEGSWLVGEEKQDHLGADDYPLTIGGRDVIPAARPYLPSSSQVPVLLVGYNLGRGALSTACRLEPVTGGDPIDLDLTVERRTETDVPGVERLAARITTGSADPGEYRMVVTLSDDATGQAVTSELPVRIY